MVPRLKATLATASLITLTWGTPVFAQGQPLGRGVAAEHGLLARPVKAARAGGTPGALAAVSGSSARDVWAVGFDTAKILIEHWDGTRWRVQPTGDVTGTLKSVVAISPPQCIISGCGD